MNANEIKEAIKANFVNENYDAACALCEEQGLFADYLQVKSKQSLASLLSYLRKQDNEPAAATETTDVEEAPATTNEQVEVKQDEPVATDEQPKKEKVSFIYFAVSLEDFDNGNVNIDNAIDGITGDTRRATQRKLNDAGHHGPTRWVCVAAKRGDEIIGYGTNKEDALNARFAA